MTEINLAMVTGAFCHDVCKSPKFFLSVLGFVIK